MSDIQYQSDRQNQGQNAESRTTGAGYTRTVPGERSLGEGLLYYFGIIWRYKWMIMGISCLVAVGSFAFALVSLRLPPEESPLPNFYTANAVLLQQRGTSQNVSDTIMASLGIEDARRGLDYGQIAIQVLNSRDFIDRIVRQNGVIERYGIEEKARTNSRNLVLASASFNFNSRTGMLTIAYQDISPRFAAQMVDSIVHELLEWFASRGGSDRLLAVRTMEEKLIEVEEGIQEIENEIEEFQQTYGVLRVEEIAETQSALLADLQSQLVAIALQISNIEEVSRMENDPELLSLRAQRENILALTDRIRQGYAGGSQLLPPRAQLPALAAKYSRLQTDLQIQQRIYQALTEQYEVSKLTADTDPAFTVLVPVEVPEEKSGPSRSKLVMAVTGGGFAGSILLAFLIHGIRKLWGDPEKRRAFGEASEI